MSKAYIIEVRNRTAGIVTGDEHGFRFFSSERAFDSLEGREFSSARDAERAARALFERAAIRRAGSTLTPILEHAIPRKDKLMITRRNILGAALVLATLAISPAQAQDKPAEIRIGTQKGGFFSAVRQRHTVEDAFKPLGIEIKWIDFQFGPPLLEAINVGSVDFGYVGDSPPIFAQAGGARIRYVAAVKSEGNTQAIIVPQDSPIKTLADLKGKRIAFGKGSSAHNLLVAALEKAGLSWSDITPAPLAPADATAAFAKGSVDAWSIWDPYLALAELKENARVIAFGKDVHDPNAFFIAASDFVEKYPFAGCAA